MSRRARDVAARMRAGDLRPHTMRALFQQRTARCREANSGARKARETMSEDEGGVGEASRRRRSRQRQRRAAADRRAGCVWSWSLSSWCGRQAGYGRRRIRTRRRDDAVAMLGQDPAGRARKPSTNERQKKNSNSSRMRAAVGDAREGAGCASAVPAVSAASAVQRSTTGSDVGWGMGYGAVGQSVQAGEVPGYVDVRLDIRWSSRTGAQAGLELDLTCTIPRAGGQDWLRRDAEGQHIISLLSAALAHAVASASVAHLLLHLASGCSMPSLFRAAIKPARRPPWPRSPPGPPMLPCLFPNRAAAGRSPAASWAVWEKKRKWNVLLSQTGSQDACEAAGRDSPSKLASSEPAPVPSAVLARLAWPRSRRLQ
jgi:hypothetical protein